MYFPEGKVGLIGNRTCIPKGIGNGSRLRQNATNAKA